MQLHAPTNDKKESLDREGYLLQGRFATEQDEKVVAGLANGKVALWEGGGIRKQMLQGEKKGW